MQPQIMKILGFSLKQSLVTSNTLARLRRYGDVKRNERYVDEEDDTCYRMLIENSFTCH